MNTMAAPTPIKHVKTRGMTEARIHALYEAISDANNNKYTKLSELLIEEWRVLLVKKRVWMEEVIPLYEIEAESRAAFVGLSSFPPDIKERTTYFCMKLGARNKKRQEKARRKSEIDKKDF